MKKHHNPTNQTIPSKLKKYHTSILQDIHADYHKELFVWTSRHFKLSWPCGEDGGTDDNSGLNWAQAHENSQLDKVSTGCHGCRVSCFQLKVAQAIYGCPYPVTSAISTTIGLLGLDSSSY